MPRTSLNQIQKQISRLQAQARKLEAAESAKKQSAVAEVLALMKKLGVTADDLKAGASGAARGRGRPRAEGARKGGARAPVPVKFRDPASGDAWSGRGRTPRWLAAHEAQGRSREEFRVA
jgi:DNA-binding protein H-NS